MASSTEGLFDVGSCTLNTLHGARVDQFITPDGLTKIISAEAPATFIPREDLETPGAVQGIVRAKRVIEHGAGDGSSQTIQEYREVCPCELFDCVAEAGAVELTRGCAPPPRPLHPHSPPSPTTLLAHEIAVITHAPLSPPAVCLVQIELVCADCDHCHAVPRPPFVTRAAAARARAPRCGGQPQASRI